MPLPTRIGPGGPFLQPPPQPLSPAAALDDGDAWWAGQLGAVGASAALALSAALCLGLQQQADELPVTTMRSGSEAFQVVAIGEAAPSYVFTADEEVLPQALSVEHSDSPAFQLPPRVAPPAPAWTAEDELPPQPVALDDGSSWSMEALRVAPVPLLAWGVDEVVGTAATAALDDGDWALAVDAQVTITVVSWPPTGGSAPVPPTVFGLDEDGWALPLPQVVRAAPLIWSAEDELPQAAAPIVAEDYSWQALRQPGLQVSPSVWAVDDECPQAAAPIVAEDDSWQAPPRSLDRVLSFAVLADDELPVADVVAPSGSSNTSSGQRQFYQPLIVRWQVVDELPTPAAPLQVVESDWQVYTPSPLSPQPLHLPDPEELPAATLRGTPEEYYWQPLPPSFGTLLAPVVRADDEIVPPAPPLQLEPDYWPLQPLLRAPYQVSSLVSVEDEIVPQPKALDEAYHWQPPYALKAEAHALDTWAIEDLTLLALLESLARTYTVNVEHRGYVVHVEHRQAVQSAEHRTLIVDSQKRSLS